MTTTDAAPGKAPARWPYVVTFLLMADVGAALAWMRFRDSEALGRNEAWAGGAAAALGIAVGWVLGRRMWARAKQEARTRAADPNAYTQPTRKQFLRMFGTQFVVYLSLTQLTRGPDLLAAAVLVFLGAGCAAVAVAVLAGR